MKGKINSFPKKKKIKKEKQCTCMPNEFRCEKKKQCTYTSTRSAVTLSPSSLLPKEKQIPKNEKNIYIYIYTYICMYVCI